jgi:hypothetical protein
MTTPDIRALCAELIEKIDYTWGDIPQDVLDLIARARAALAQPDGHGLTEDQLDVTVIAIQALIPSPNPWDTHSLEAVDRGHEILQRALARWGRPASPAPEPGEVAELVAEVELMANHAAAACQFGDAKILSSAATLLQQLSAPAPASNFTTTDLSMELATNRKILQELDAATARIETLLHIGGMTADADTLPECLREMLGEQSNKELLEFFPGIPENLLEGIDNEEYTEIVEWLVRNERLGFFVQFATPVMRGTTSTYSWGRYTTKWVYADTLGESVVLGLKWVADCRAKELNLLPRAGEAQS